MQGKCLANGQGYNGYEFTTFGAFVMLNDLLFPCLTVKGIRIDLLSRDPFV